MERGSFLLSLSFERKAERKRQRSEKSCPRFLFPSHLLLLFLTLSLSLAPPHPKKNTTSRSDNWSRPDLQFIRPWLRAQAEVSKLLRKPVLLEEFGKVAAVGELWKDETEENKLRYYRRVYDEVVELSAQIKGILFW